MSRWYAVYKQTLENQVPRRKDQRVVPMTFPEGSKGPGKYRTDKTESNEHDWGKTKKDKPEASTP